MTKYPKIQSIFKRDKKTHEFIIGSFTYPEFEYLKDMLWEATEKIDGTNIRVIWDLFEVNFKGRSDKAIIPQPLFKKLEEMFPVEKFKKLYPETSMCLYGEGFGNKIQKGRKYIPDGVSFILFDILIKDIWLQRKDIEDIASRLEINVVPFVNYYTLEEAMNNVKLGIISRFGNFKAEGLVLKPKIPLLRRNGERIITKVKNVDFK